MAADSLQPFELPGSDADLRRAALVASQQGDRRRSRGGADLMPSEAAVTMPSPHLREAVRKGSLPLVRGGGSRSRVGGGWGSTRPRTPRLLALIR